jgi:hypothetical protein
MKLLFENWRKHLDEAEGDAEAQELLCQALAKLFGGEPPYGTLITIGEVDSKDNKQFVYTPGQSPCVAPYRRPTAMQVHVARGLGGDLGYDKPTGHPLEEKQSKVKK